MEKGNTNNTARDDVAAAAVLVAGLQERAPKRRFVYHGMIR